MSDPLRIGVLVSGRGSNLQAVLDAIAAGSLNARVAVVISDTPAAPALDRARAAGAPVHVLPTGKYRSRLTDAAEVECVECLRDHDVQLVFLAGFMRILHETLLDAFAGAIINIHPSLLPAFPGLDAQRQALDYGVKLAGATVHFVDAGIDAGPIIAQRVVPVMPGDDRDSLADRILIQEHMLVVEALQLFAAGRVHLRGRQVVIEEDQSTAATSGSRSTT